MTFKLRFVLLLNAVTTLFMTGLIWFVQVVHYPLFDAVGEENFASYEARHSSLTTLVVIVQMFVELITSIVLLWQRPPGIAVWQLWLGAVLVAGIWFSTAFLQVPQHSVLSAGFDARAHALLVTTNWLRTIAWTVRSLLVLGWLYGRMK